MTNPLTTANPNLVSPTMHTPTKRALTALTLALIMVIAACSSNDAETTTTTSTTTPQETQTLTVYSGRAEDLVAPLIQGFTAATGIQVEVRYASSTDMAATIREEGANSPADVFFAQDPASLGAVAEAGLFTTLPGDLLDLVPAQFSDDGGHWVGVSARSRVVIYNSEAVSAADLPDTVDGFTESEWNGRLAIAPGNASFIAFVAEMILERGEDATAEWLEAIADNDPELFSGNGPIVAAVNDGAIDVGLVNHYYLLGLQSEVGETVAANHFFSTPHAGSLVMPAGAGILASSDNQDAAQQFIEFLLHERSQTFFAEETFEYPVVAAVEPPAGLPPLSELSHPSVNLSDLATVLDTATQLITEAGLL